MGKKGIALRLGSPAGKFSLIHVHDLTDVIVRCLEVDNIRSAIFEVDDGYPNGYSWKSVFQIMNPHMKVQLSVPANFLWFMGKSNEIFSRVFGYSPLLTTGKVAELTHTNWVCHTSAALEQLGWTPKIPLEEGLRHLFASDSLMVTKKN